ncbi:3-deoxy-D-manno-octulosonic acid transferase [Tateyamaria sp. SN6-1]|uniref:3-deoxy-D-manno-octulosonic acid transferase n=1 Tax=Tateyamaria sp. SN6-1 TaxID=3092148 RepID=UPI0039F49891
MGLAAYRTLSGRKPAPAFAPVAPRPAGELVWVHAGEAGNGRAVADLAQRIATQRDGCTVLLTGVAPDDPGAILDGVLVDAIAGDHPALVAQFVTHWAPDIVIWTWGGLMPNVILAAQAHGAHLILVDAGHDGFDRRRDRWLPEVPRRLLAQFDVVMARSRDAFTRLAQLGRPVSEIELVSPLHPFGHTLPASDTDVSDVGEALHGRPTWLAAHVDMGEIPIVLAAHRQALKASHRLLLILLVADMVSAKAARDIATQRGLNVACWADGAYPDDHTQVLVADAVDELGLWLRVAPVAFVGGSLASQTADHDPYTFAAHGTAVIYGPYVPTHAPAYKRLLDAGAARIVNDASSLGLAVTQMIAPDRAAQMAMAGWDVLTEGADSLDRIIGRVQSHLDARAGVMS